jgi:hypothetical protein
MKSKGESETRGRGDTEKVRIQNAEVKNFQVNKETKQTKETQ